MFCLINELLRAQLSPNTGIIEDDADSLFAYQTGQDVRDPDYIPQFETTFSNAALEQEAHEICGENALCLYDIAVTGRTDIGQSTLIAAEDYENQVSLSRQCK